MGAVHGHLMHPYDNLSLRFRDLKAMFAQITNGELDSVCEKFDGQNIFLHVDANGTPWFARNLTDIKDGKVSSKDIDNRFAGRGPVHITFRDAALVATELFSGWSADKIARVFGGNTWYSAEIIHTDNPNVIKYDTCALIFHWDGTGSRDAETGHAISTKAHAQAFKVLTDSLPPTVNVQGLTWKIGTSFKANLNKLTYDEFTSAVSVLDETCTTSDLHHNATLKDFVAKKIEEDLLAHLNLADDYTSLVMERMFDEKGALPAPSITKGMNPSLKTSLRDIMKRRKQIREDYLSPIVSVVRKVAFHALDNTASNLVKNHDAEVKRLQNEYEKALAVASSRASDRDVKILQKCADQLVESTQITSSQEGVVFKFDGQSYKLTGIFAPLNQVLGLNKDWSK